MSCLFCVALWSPAGKGLTSWLSCVLCVMFFSLFQMCPGPHQNQGRGWIRETSLSPPVKYFTDHFKARYFFCGSFVFFVSCVSHAFASVHWALPCGHLLWKGWPLGSCWWCLLHFCYFTRWYLGSGVVLDCIVSWSLPSFLLLSNSMLRQPVAFLTEVFITTQPGHFFHHL